jgi:hypothetical protein
LRSLLVLSQSRNSPILWNQTVHCSVYKCPSPVLILTQIHLVHAVHPMSRRSILMISHIYVRVFQVVCFPQVLPIKTLYAPLLSSIRATCSTRLILLDLITPITSSKQYRSLSYSLCSFVHSPVTSSLSGSNILLNTLFSNTLSLRPYLNVSDRVSQSHRATHKIIILYISIFIFLDSKQ